VLTTWLVSLDIPAGGGEKKPRPSTLALRRFRRVVEVRAAEPLPSRSEAAAGVSRAPSEAAASATLDRSSRNVESSHAKGLGKADVGLIESRDHESSHVIESRRRDPWAARLKRVRATLAKARAIADWIACEPKRRPADAARREHVTRARICQLLRLMKLAPEIWRDIEQPGRTGAVLGEKELRMLAGCGTKEQVRRYRALLGLDQPKAGEGAVADVRKQARHRGLAQHLAHARELQALVESGRFSSVRALARHAGLSGTRVSQLLGLLDLAPEILAAIEAAGEQELGVTEKALRVIARMEERVQVREWRQLMRSRTANSTTPGLSRLRRGGGEEDPFGPAQQGSADQ
jgi:hypothetical protein